MRVNAYMNHGRWLINCPKCGSPLPAEVAGGFSACPNEWPDLLAMAYVPGRGGKFDRIADPVKRQAALNAAAKAGELYEAVYPAARDDLERLLRQRQTDNMNWNPGETIGMVLADNLAHGLGG